MNPTRKTATNWLSDIGYRISDIGYRLILGVLVSVFAVTAFAADCKVNDSDISGEYAGGCVNGLASGKGVAKGKHEYSGSFLNGNKHGFGVFTQSDGLVYTGQFRNDSANGQGVIVWSGGI